MQGRRIKGTFRPREKTKAYLSLNSFFFYVVSSSQSPVVAHRPRKKQSHSLMFLVFWGGVCHVCAAVPCLWVIRASHGQGCRGLVVWFALPFARSLVQARPALRSKTYLSSPNIVFSSQCAPPRPPYRPEIEKNSSSPRTFFADNAPARPSILDKMSPLKRRGRRQRTSSNGLRSGKKCQRWDED